MAGSIIRDQVADHLLTPENSAVVVIDYQPVQVNSILSMDGLIILWLVDPRCVGRL